MAQAGHGLDFEAATGFGAAKDPPIRPGLKLLVVSGSGTH
jgi:hypothetical protein